MKKIFLVLFFSLSLGFVLNAIDHREDLQNIESLLKNIEISSNEDPEICYFWYSEKYADGTSVSYYIAYRCGTIAQLMDALP